MVGFFATHMLSRLASRLVSCLVSCLASLSARPSARLATRTLARKMRMESCELFALPLRRFSIEALNKIRKSNCEIFQSSQGANFATLLESPL